MGGFWDFPSVKDVSIDDWFWTPYLESVRTVMLPYVLDKFEEDGYLENYDRVARGETGGHRGPHFSDGLLMETLRGACDFLAARPDMALRARVDGIVKRVRAASLVTDGFLSTWTLLEAPDRRWGENGGDIVIQHDLYNHGALIEAAVSHYRATGETVLLDCAVRAANLICAYMGDAPKRNVIPGHSLPEEAFVRLFVLFRDTRALDEYAGAHGVHYDDYLRMADFWYRARGRHEGRGLSSRFAPAYNQDDAPFEQARQAVGHSVRAALCYTGAAAVAREYGDGRYTAALDAIWRNVYDRKLHVSGGIGTRHDIEGFDADYNLPGDAYLETCAAIAFMFWAGEMSRLRPRAEYYDGFERALYNNVLAAVGPDFTHFFYQNPLVSPGGVKRWAWHGCPCCPPMLIKLFSSLQSYIYSYRTGALNVNLLIGSRFETADFSIEQHDGRIRVDSRGRALTLRVRMPRFADGFGLSIDGRPLDYEAEDGYAAVTRVWADTVSLAGMDRLTRVFANPRVAAERGNVAVMDGPFLYCAEGIDNGGDVDFTIAKEPRLMRTADGVTGWRQGGGTFKLIPYYQWCRRATGRSEDDRMAVWFRQEDMRAEDELAREIGENLYGDYR